MFVSQRHHTTGVGAASISNSVSLTLPVADSPDTTKEEHGKVARLLLKAKKQYQAGQRAEARLRRDMQDDRRFRLGRLGDESFQWPDRVWQQRKTERRATLQTNRMPAFVALARNAVLAANLRPHVQPVDDKADVKTAEVLGALIRNTEHLSQVEAVYTSAIDSMAENGRGYLQITTEWADDTSWNQRPRLKRVLNPFRVLVDPSAQEPDQRDAEYAFLETDYDADTWEEEFGSKDKPLPTRAGTGWTGTEDQYRSNWFPSNKKVRVMDWYCAEYDKETLYELLDGQTALGLEALDEVLMTTLDPGLVKELEGMNKKDHEATMVVAREQMIERQRPVKRRTIVLRRIDAKYIHQETVWPTPWQPFIPWVHEETDYLGERDMRGTVRDAKDAQRVYNVNVSSLSEAVNDAPKNRVVGYKGQFGKPDSMTRKGWENAPNKRFAFLEVEPITIDGKPAPFPQPFNVEPAIMGLAHAIAQADNDLKATGRFHDASLAESGPEQSGKAIIARQRQDELSNGGFINGHLIGLASTCRHLIFLYRVLYTEAQIVRITGDDDQKKKVMIYNGEEGDPRKQDGFEPDKELKDDDFFDIGAGQYDVEVKPGPQAGSRREEDLRIVGEFVTKLPPEYMMNFMDLLFELVDAPAGRKLSERAGKLLPEHLRDEGEQAQQDPAQLQAKLQQAAEQHQQLMEAFEEAKRQIETKQIEADNKARLQEAALASKEGIEQAKLVVEWTKVMAQSDNEEAKNTAKAEVDRIFAEIDAKRLRLDSKKADDSFVLGEHKIQSSSAASKPGAAQVEGNQGGR